MAILKAPLFSLGASQKLGDSLVFFNWKGLNVVREYVIPSNPNSTGQSTQRGYLTSAVAAVHALMSHPVFPLGERDKSAYALWGSTFATPRTWFNQAVKNFIDQKHSALSGNVFSSDALVTAADEIDIDLYNNSGDITAGNFHYGTSKTALLATKAAAVAGQKLSADITGLVTGTKYYIQFRATTPAAQVGVRSGIYYAVAG